MRRSIVGFVLMTATACSSVETRYIRAGYDSAARDAVKHITIVSIAEDQEMAGLLAKMTSARVKLKTNYLVHGEAQAAPGWPSGCWAGDETAPAIEGVLSVRILDEQREADDVRFRVEGRLLRCRDGALLWHAEVSESADSNDEDLASFAQDFVDEFPLEAPRSTGPLLINLIELLDALPEVMLTEEEEITKIELS